MNLIGVPETKRILSTKIIFPLFEEDNFMKSKTADALATTNKHYLYYEKFHIIETSKK